MIFVMVDHWVPEIEGRHVGCNMQSRYQPTKRIVVPIHIPTCEEDMSDQPERSEAQGPSTAQAKAAMEIVIAVAQAIKELGSVPNGVLYAHLMGRLSLDSYTKIIDLLKSKGIVKEENNLLTYVLKDTPTG
jgi:hypothetical protein